MAVEPIVPLTFFVPAFAICHFSVICCVKQFASNSLIVLAFNKIVTAAMMNAAVHKHFMC